MKAIGIFGGTFDPVHIGHLRTAVELRQLLNLEVMHLLPCADPPHRDQPMVSAEHRFAMLQRALVAEPGLLADDREMRRGGLTYTVDTLREMRAEYGPDAALCLCLGMDSLVNLHSWHRWCDIVEFAHIVVACRPGWHLPESGPVAGLLADRLVNSADMLHHAPSGHVLVAEMTLLPIAATWIRTQLMNAQSVRYVVPDPVIEYIERHHLYQQETR